MLLRRFGGDVTLTDDCVVVINGVSALRGTAVKGMDPLSGMALLIAALQAEGESGIVDGGHIARSFSYMDAALRQLGAELEFTE